MKSYLTSVMICLFWLLVLTSMAYSRTWHVRPDGSGDAPSIQAALDSSATGDTVLVAGGTYNIESMIHCFQKQQLMILGEDGTDPVILNGVGNYGWLVLDWSQYITLRGFTFSNCPFGVNWSGGLLIEKNIFKDMSHISTTGGGSIEIRDNLVYSCGDGIYCADDGIDISIHNNVIANNRGGPGGYQGYAMFLDLGSYTVYNNIVTNNNHGIASVSTSLSLSCNDVWGNEVSNYDLAFGPPNPTGIDGNISVDPQFCGVAPEISGNFFLQSDSPCAPGNHPDGASCGLIGAYGVGCSTTAAKRTTWGGIKSTFK